MVGAGTDYAVFLISRYHDYVRLGADSDQAVKQGFGVHRQSDRRVGGHRGGHLSRDDLLPIAGICHSRSGNFDFDRCGVRCCGESASRHPGARRTTWLDQATTRPHQSFLAAFGHTHRAPAKDPSGRQFDRAHHPGQLREPGPLQLRRSQDACRVLPRAPSDMPRWIAISRRTRSFLSSSSFSHHTTCGTPKPLPTSSRWRSG